MKMSSREIALGLATVAAALFAVTGLLSKAKIEHWKEARAEQSEVRRKIEMDREMAAQREQWQARLAEISRLLPVQPEGRKVDVHWLSVMDRIAGQHGLSIKRRQAGKEEQQGDVFELPIECEWEGSLESLVYFLFELQSEGAMLDVRQMMIRPAPGGVGSLRGRFTLFAAYTRGAQP